MTKVIAHNKKVYVVTHTDSILATRPWLSKQEVYLDKMQAFIAASYKGDTVSIERTDIEYR